MQIKKATYLRPVFYIRKDSRYLEAMHLLFHLLRFQSGFFLVFSSLPFPLVSTILFMTKKPAELAVIISIITPLARINKINPRSILFFHAEKKSASVWDVAKFSNLDSPQCCIEWKVRNILLNLACIVLIYKAWLFFYFFFPRERGGGILLVSLRLPPVCHLHRSYFWV